MGDIVSLLPQVSMRVLAVDYARETMTVQLEDGTCLCVNIDELPDPWDNLPDELIDCYIQAAIIEDETGTHVIF